MITGGRDRGEPVIEPELPIIDPHIHIWDRTAMLAQMDPPTFGWQHVMMRTPRFLAEDWSAAMEGGHNIIATVYVECGSFYHADGPEQFRPVGETEAVAAIAGSFANAGNGRNSGFCSGIVAFADLASGDQVAEVLEQHVNAGNGRLKGIRYGIAHDPDPEVLGPINAPDPRVFESDAFRAGFARLAPLNLSFDAYLLEPQLPELTRLAQQFPETQIILDHLGTPLGLASYSGRRDERFAAWKESLSRLAELPNVTVKLGGLGMELAGFPSFLAYPAAGSQDLSTEWRPYIETAIELFGTDRCMFESNFPAESGTATYGMIWNAFKHVCAEYSADEKADLFSLTAARVYRI